MSTIKPGDLAFVKTTGEQVFVLAINRIEDVSYTDFADGPVSSHGIPPALLPLGAFSGLVARVRLPRLTQSGIRHYLVFFRVEELELPEDKVLRDLDLVRAVRERTAQDEKVENALRNVN